MNNGCKRGDRHGLTLTDLLVSLAIVCFLCGVALCEGVRVRESSARVRCAANLKQIGLAIQLYCNENRGNYPRTVYEPGDALAQYTGIECKDPFGKGNTPKVNDITAAIFLLVRTQDITTEVFVCPSTDAQMMKYPDGKTAQDFGNFRSERELTYSMANVYPEKKVVEAGYRTNATVGAEVAIMADMNPGTVGECDVTPKTGPKDENAAAAIMRKANSMNHRGIGQNVLYGDGHAEFARNPFCGQKRDNIYTVSGSDDGSKTTSETIAGSPKWSGDSVLLPAATGEARKKKAGMEELKELREDLRQDVSLTRVELGIEQLRNGKSTTYDELKKQIDDLESEIADVERQLKEGEKK